MPISLVVHDTSGLCWDFGGETFENENALAGRYLSLVREFFLGGPGLSCRRRITRTYVNGSAFAPSGYAARKVCRNV
jgi:hypothetical protein